MATTNMIVWNYNYLFGCRWTRETKQLFHGTTYRRRPRSLTPPHASGAPWRIPKMLVRTESTRWRCCSMILVTLTPLMLSMGARIGSEQETFNAARNQPVVVEPARATCGFNNVDWVDTYSQGVAYCLHGCVRNVSTVSQRERIFPSGVVEMGGHRCRTKRIEARFMKSYKRRNVGERRTLCYILYENPYSESPGDYTYSVWIKPTDTQTEQ